MNHNLTDKSNEIAAALIKLGITTDKLFERIRNDLERGLVAEARANLDFVDILTANEYTN